MYICDKFYPFDTTNIIFILGSLTKIPTGIEQFIQLQRLELYHNKITEIPASINKLSQLIYYLNFHIIKNILHITFFSFLFTYFPQYRLSIHR